MFKYNVAMYIKNSKNVWLVRHNVSGNYCDIVNASGFNFVSFIKEIYQRCSAPFLFPCPLTGYLEVKNFYIKSNILENIQLIKPLHGEHKLAFKTFTKDRELLLYYIVFFKVDMVGDY